MSGPPTQQPEQVAPLAANGRDHPGPVSAACPPEPRSTALFNAAAHARLWIVGGLGLALDLWSKDWAFHTLRQGGHRVLIPHVLEFHTTLNPGALFGIGAGHAELFLIASVLALALVMWMFSQCPARQRMTHIALGAILAGALGNMYDRALVRLIRYPARTPAGNVYRYYTLGEARDTDRVLLHEYPLGDGQSNGRTGRTLELSRARADNLEPPIGYVRDFIKIPTRWFGEREVWPWIFNVADMMLVGGVVILAIRLLRDRRSHTRPVADSDLDASADKT